MTLSKLGFLAFDRCAAASKATQPMDIGSVVLKTATIADIDLRAQLGNAAGSSQVDGCSVVWKQLLGGRYTLLVVTPEEEITKSIDEQRSSILVDAWLLTLVCVAISVTTFIVLVWLVSRVSVIISTPLSKTSKEAAIIR